MRNCLKHIIYVGFQIQATDGKVSLYVANNLILLTFVCHANFTYSIALIFSTCLFLHFEYFFIVTNFNVRLSSINLLCSFYASFFD